MPLLRHYNNTNFENCNLEQFEIKRIKKRIKDDETDLSCIKASINNSNKQKFNSLNEILNEQDIKLAKQIDHITYNADHINFSDLDKYVKEQALPNFIKLYKMRVTKNSAEKTAYRKLFVAWDIIKFLDV